MSLTDLEDARAAVVRVRAVDDQVDDKVQARNASFAGFRWVCRLYDQ